MEKEKELEEEEQARIKQAWEKQEKERKEAEELQEKKRLEEASKKYEYYKPGPKVSYKVKEKKESPSEETEPKGKSKK